MKRYIVVVIVGLLLGAPSADAGCHTHRCWERVRVNNLEHMVEKKIDRITPYSCYGYQSVKPCWVITQESSTKGFWTAYNPDSCGSGYHARGLYQLCGHGEPWPVIVTWGRRIWRKYRTLKNELAHHRIASGLSLSNW